jgi:hypothetical protein
MPDARIPSLEPHGLHVVPGYRVDPVTGDEDPTWRAEWFAWREAVREVRLEVQDRCAHDLRFRAEQQKINAADPAYFVAMWLVAEEPRGLELAIGEAEEDEAEDEETYIWESGGEFDDDDPILEFIPFAYQVELIQLFARVNSDRRKQDVYIEKARGIGVSYVFLAAAYWAFLYRPWRGIFLSDKLDHADRAMDLSSLFGKVDLFVFYTPAWMRPKNWNGKSQKHRRQGLFRHPATTATLSAVATTPDAGRSERGRYTASDESAFQEHWRDTHDTMGGTVRHRWAWTTPSYKQGVQWENAFTEVKKHHKNARANGKRPIALAIELDWYINPYHDKDWYAEEFARYQASGREAAFAVEYLRNAAAGYSTFIYPEVERCPNTPHWYDPSKMLNCSVDPGVKDETAWVFWQTHFEGGHKTVRWLESYTRKGMPAEFYAHVITGIWPEPGDLMWDDEEQFGERERYLMNWLASVPTHMLRAYGDPAVAADFTGVVRHKPSSFVNRFFTETGRLRRSREIENPTPIYIFHKELFKRNRHQDRRTAMHEALIYSEFSTTEGAQELKHAISRVRLQEMTEKSTSPPGWIHDHYTHPTSAAEFGMTYETMKLTLSEIAPKSLETIKPIAHRRKGSNAPGGSFKPIAGARSQPSRFAEVP